MNFDSEKSNDSEFYVQTKFGRMLTRRLGVQKENQSAIVLIHGMIISGSYMMPLAQILCSSYDILVPDLPGYGRSEKPKKILGIKELAEALAEWMEALSVTKAHFVANSFGCQIAAEFAVQYPDKVETLVLQGPTVDAHARNLFRQAIRLKLNSYRESKSVGMISIRDYRSAGLRRILKTIAMTMKDHIEEKLSRISVPTLVVRGELDVVVPEAWAEEVVRRIPRGQLVVIPLAAHTLNYSEPNRFAEVIINFLEDQKRRRTYGTDDMGKDPTKGDRSLV